MIKGYIGIEQELCDLYVWLLLLVGQLSFAGAATYLIASEETIQNAIAIIKFRRYGSMNQAFCARLINV